MNDYGQNGTSRNPARRGSANFAAPDLPAHYDAPHGDVALQYPSIGEDDEQFSPAKLIWFCFKYRWLIASLVAIGLAVGFALTTMKTPKYRATAQLEILAPSARVIQDLQVVQENVDTYLALNTALQKLKSRELARRVVHALNLAHEPDFLFPPANLSFGNLLKRVTGWRDTASNTELDVAQRERIAVARVRAGLSAELIRSTSILSISYSSTEPRFASAVANQFAKSFIDQRIDQTADTSDLASQFIREQVAEVKIRLQKSEKALVEYAKAKGITINGEDGSLVAANIKSINEALGTAIQERLRAERLVKQINAGNGENLPEVLGNEGLQPTRARLSELKAEYRQKLNKFKPGFPEMRELNSQIQELQRQLRSGVHSILSTINLKFEDAIENEHNLRLKLSELETLYAEFQDKNIQYTILKREVDSNRKQYDSLIGKLNDVGVSSEIKSKRATVIEAAVTPGSPYSPRMSINLLIALAVSCGLAAAIVYLIELFNNTFSNPDQIESELKLPVLGVIPKVEDSKIIAQLDDPQSSLSEAFRSLRTSLQFSGTGGAPRILMVTSAEPSEGKSTTIRKLAEEFGALGMKVLVVDADMRRPNLHRILGVPNGMGLSNLLTNMIQNDNQNELDTFLVTPWPNVTYVTSGTPPPNPANLLSSEKMGLFVRGCAERYDMVLIDAPPIIGLADALVVSRLADATLMVVAAHQVARKPVQSALKRLRTAGAHVVGASLIKFDVNRAEYNYAYQYMANNYYGYREDPRAAKLRAPNDSGQAIANTQ